MNKRIPPAKRRTSASIAKTIPLWRQSQGVAVGNKMLRRQIKLLLPYLRKEFRGIVKTSTLTQSEVSIILGKTQSQEVINKIAFKIPVSRLEKLAKFEPVFTKVPNFENLLQALIYKKLLADMKAAKRAKKK